MAESVEIQLKLIENVSNQMNKVNEKLEETKKEVEAANSKLEKMSTTFMNMSNIMNVASQAFGLLTSLCSGATEAYNVQLMAETKLTTVMRQRTGATDEQIQSIKDLASAQQRLGVIGDEVQLSGAQQLGTFVTETETIKTLIPAMNNLLAQQKGLSATSGDAVNIGNLMGKVLQGQTSALTRVGITFTEAQEQVLKFGTESERAAMLAQVITDNVGNMNEQLALTDSGRVQQVNNDIGDMKERIGGVIISLEASLIPVVNQLIPIADSLISFVEVNLPAISSLIMGVANAVMSLAGFMSAWSPVIAAVTAGIAAYNVVTSIAIIKTNIITAATKAWAVVQGVLNVLLTMNPIGLVVIAIAALVAAVVACWLKFDKFRAAIKGTWDTIKQFGVIIKDFVIDRVKGVISGLGAMGSAIAKLFKGDFSGAISEAKRGIVQLSGYEAAAKAVAKAKNISLVSNYNSRLAQERADKQSNKETGTNNTLNANTPLINANNALATTNVEAPKTAKTKAEATATGGTRNTNITINFDKEMVRMEFNGGYMENAESVENTLEESLLRVLMAAKASI